MDLLPRIRKLAVNHAGGAHPWKELSDTELLKSAGLYGKDMVTGEQGYNLAGLLLLGKDEVIADICPAYMTDALLRRVNVDRYDDREIVRTNLVESYDRLLAFAIKHLPDKFFLEDTARISLRNILVREMISNTLMHREYSSSYMAKFVIQGSKMYVENASRALREGEITPENLEPYQKNPLISAFFRNIGFADTLGSGTRKLFKYTQYYSGNDPKLSEGDIFRIVVPLSEAYSYDRQIETAKVRESNVNADKAPISADKAPIKTPERSPQEHKVYAYLAEHGSISSAQAEALLGVKQRRAREILSHMAKKGILKKCGAYKSTVYVRFE